MTRRKRRQKQSTTYEAAEGAVPTASRLVVTVSCIAAIVAIIQGMRETPTIANGTVALIPSPMSTTVSSPDSLPPTDPPAAAGVTQPSVRHGSASSPVTGTTIRGQCALMV
jgi:hypothetical protein